MDRCGGGVPAAGAACGDDAAPLLSSCPPPIRSSHRRSCAATLGRALPTRASSCSRGPRSPARASCERSRSGSGRSATRRGPSSGRSSRTRSPPSSSAATRAATPSSSRAARSTRPSAPSSAIWSEGRRTAPCTTPTTAPRGSPRHCCRPARPPHRRGSRLGPFSDPSRTLLGSFSDPSRAPFPQALRCTIRALNRSADSRAPLERCTPNEERFEVDSHGCGEGDKNSLHTTPLSPTVLGRLRAADAEACCGLCNADEACAGWTFLWKWPASALNCVLLEAFEGVTHYEGRVTRAKVPRTGGGAGATGAAGAAQQTRTYIVPPPLFGVTGPS